MFPVTDRCSYFANITDFGDRFFCIEREKQLPDEINSRCLQQTNKIASGFIYFYHVLPCVIQS